MEINLRDYYNRYSKSKFWDRILALAGRYIQSAEFNEAQDMVAERIKGLGDSIYRDGDVISGCEIAVDAGNAIVRLGAGKVYCDGAVRELIETSLPIPLNATVEVGVVLVTKIETEIENGTLREPAENTPAYNQPGAARRIVTAEWGLNTGTHLGQSSSFQRVYTISEAHVVTATAETKSYLGEYVDILARYDRESHGFYLISGLAVTVQDAPPGKQAFSISEGKAHVRGYEVTTPYAIRLVVDEDADVQDAESEPHTYAPVGGLMRVEINHSPIDTITKVSVTKERMVSIVHGNYSGCSDSLPDTSITQIVSIKQGSTIYVSGSDYKLTADRVDWSPLGNEPAPGSTYEVTYHYRVNVEPQDVDTHGFTVSGLVSGSLILIDYTYRLPRRDLIVLDQEGNFSQVKGVPHRYAPAYPSTPTHTILLAQVQQDWGEKPIVKNVAVRAVKMDTLETMQKSIVRLHDLVALERLKTDALISAPSSVHGVFVDPFIDDDMRDQGTVQSGAIMGGELSIPFVVDVVQFPAIGATMLDYSSETILQQTCRTNSMKINPYHAFEPMPARAFLDPSVDRWNFEETAWMSSITQHLTSGSGNMSSTSTATSVENLGSISREDTVMRVREVAVHAEGFGNGEVIESVTFDGLDIDLGVQAADASGCIDATFMIPSGITVGTKLFQINGRHTTARATYTGTGTITTQIVRNVTTITTMFWNVVVSVDPLAQTFTLSEPRHVDSIDVFFTVAGASVVRLQIRETQTGLPTSAVIGEAELKPSQLRENAINRFTFEKPIFLSAGVEYAIVAMTDTADHELAIAKLGEYDVENGWMKAQPYQGGVLLSSSNASTWTPHQDTDLWFRLNAAKFNASKAKRIILGTVVANKVTDIIPLGEVDYTSARTDVTFIFTEVDTDKEVARVQPGQLLSMPEAISGTYRIDAELSGEANFSPVLYDGVQIVLASLQDTGDYVSRSFACGVSKKVSVRIEAILPGSSSMKVYVQTGTSAWAEATHDGYDEIGDGWRRHDYSYPCSRTESRVKIVLTGTPAERPRARALRAVTFDA